MLVLYLYVLVVHAPGAEAHVDPCHRLAPSGRLLPPPVHRSLVFLMLILATCRSALRDRLLGGALDGGVARVSGGVERDSDWR